MADGAALLRMLEPTVRPVQTPGTSGPPSAPGAASQQPLDQRPFESLLNEAQQMAQAGSADSGSSVAAAQPSEIASSPASPSATAPSTQIAETASSSASAGQWAALNGLNQVENASLRQIMAHASAKPPNIDENP